MVIALLGRFLPDLGPRRPVCRAGRPLFAFRAPLCASWLHACQQRDYVVLAFTVHRFNVDANVDK